MSSALRYCSDKNFFCLGVSIQQIWDALSLLCPKCPDCSQPILHFCLEPVCRNHDFLFCWDCSHQDHILHRTHELLVFFTDSELYRFESLDYPVLMEALAKAGAVLGKLKAISS